MVATLIKMFLSLKYFARKPNFILGSGENSSIDWNSETEKQVASG